MKETKNTDNFQKYIMKILLRNNDLCGLLFVHNRIELEKQLFALQHFLILNNNLPDILQPNTQQFSHKLFQKQEEY